MRWEDFDEAARDVIELLKQEIRSNRALIQEAIDNAGPDMEKLTLPGAVASLRRRAEAAEEEVRLLKQTIAKLQGWGGK